MAKQLDAYKLAVTFDADGAKALSTIKTVDAQATKASSTFGKLKNDIKSAFSGGSAKAGEQLATQFVAGVSGGFSNIGQTLGTVIGTAIAPGVGTAVGSVVGAAVDKTISAVAGGVIDLIKRGIDLNAQLERAKISLTTLSGSEKTAALYLQNIKELSLTSGLEMPSLITATQRLEDFNNNLELTKLELKAAADQAAAMGGGVDTFNAIANSLGLIAEKGELSSKNLLKLERQGIPAMKYLAEATGLSVKQLKELSNTGQLRGDVAARLISEGIEAHRGGLAANLANNTLTGLQARNQALQDARAIEGTGNITETLKLGYQGANAVLASSGAQQLSGFIDQSAGKLVDKIKQVAQTANEKGLGPALTELTEETAKTVAGGIFEGIGRVALDHESTMAAGKKIGTAIAEGIGVGTSGTEIENAIAGGAAKLISGFKNALGIKSPSKVFTDEVGVPAAQGIGVGLEAGIASTGVATSVENAADLLINRFIDRTSLGLKKWGKAIEKAGGEEFLKAVEAMSGRLKVDPNKVMNVMAFESGLNPAKKNPGSSATGLIQFMAGTAGELGTTVDKLREMNAIEQLKFVEAYFKQFKQLADTQEAVYTAVLAGHSVSDPDSILFKTGSRAYAANSALDKDASGTITAGEAAAQAYKQGFLSGGRVIQGGRAGLTVIGEQDHLKEINLELADLSTRILPKFKNGLETVINGGTVNGGHIFGEPEKLKEINLDLIETQLRGGGRSAGMFGRGGYSQSQQAARAALVKRSSAGFFSGVTRGAHDEITGEADSHASKGQSAVAGLKSTLQDLKEMGKGSFKEFASGIGKAVSDFALLGETGPAALKKITAQVLASAASEAAVKGIMALADGFVHLFTNPAQSAADFTAAGLYFSIAAATGLVGRAVAGNSFKDKGAGNSAAQQQANDRQATDAGNPQNHFTRRATGGPVYRGRAYIVGDGGREEVFDPQEDGYLYPSVDAYKASRGRGQNTPAGAQAIALAQLMHKLDQHFSRLEAVSSTDHFLRMTKQHPGAVGAATLEAINRNDALGRRMGQRIAA